MTPALWEGTYSWGLWEIPRSKRGTWQESKVFEEPVGVRVSDSGILFFMRLSSPLQADGTWEHPGKVKHE